MAHRPEMRAVVAALVAGGLGVWLQAAASAPVADAAMQHDSVAVRALLRQGADVNAAQGDGMTALHWAATHGDVELADVLLYAGANVRATSRLGRYTPLHVASQNGAAAVVKALIGRGAEVAAATSTGATPLMLAAQSGQVDTVTALLDADAEVNAVETTHGQSALMFAAAYDRAEVVRLLTAHGAKLDATSKIVDLAALTDPGEGDGRPPEPQGGQTGAEPDRRRRRSDSLGPRHWPPGCRRHRRGRRDPSISLQRAHRHPRAACRRCISRRGRARRRRCGRWSTPAPT